MTDHLILSAKKSKLITIDKAFYKLKCIDIVLYFSTQTCCGNSIYASRKNKYISGYSSYLELCNHFYVSDT